MAKRGAFSSIKSASVVIFSVKILAVLRTYVKLSLGNTNVSGRHCVGYSGKGDRGIKETLLEGLTPFGCGY